MPADRSNESIIRLNEVIERTSLSRSTLYAYMNKGLFPKPVKLGLRAVGWYASEVNDWIVSR